MFAISPMPGSRGTFAQSISSDVCGDARSSAWLPRPKPVRSVQAWTFSRSSFGKSGGTAFSFAMFSSAAFTFSGAKSPAFIAVTAMPVPTGFVSSRQSPSRAVPTVHIALASTSPNTTRPYFGSSSCTLCPPASIALASIILCAPPSSIS